MSIHITTYVGTIKLLQSFVKIISIKKCDLFTDNSITHNIISQISKLSNGRMLLKCIELHSSVYLDYIYLPITITSLSLK
jgi:hypothetical protein